MRTTGSNLQSFHEKHIKRRFYLKQSFANSKIALYIIRRIITKIGCTLNYKKFSGHTFYESMNPEFEKTMPLDVFEKENCSKTFQKPKFAVGQQGVFRFSQRHS